MTVFENIFFYLGLVLTLVLVLFIFFSKNGVLEYRQLKQQEVAILAQEAQADKENQKIEKEIRRLKQDINYIKHLAKHEHEMAEPDELIFKDKPEKKETEP